jgi:cation diffusion facilitator family transporter
MTAHQASEQHQANREKTFVALTSVAAAVLLTSTKLTVGLLTNSLGILSEAAHSGLDLVAAAVTYFAVRASGRPPDKEHTYGHGKIENLSALFQTLLLLVTCVWIIWEALDRLLGQPHEVDVTAWSFIVIAGSIVVDFSRSRALMRVAKKYDSQALEADALHFSTDIWSSAVVLGGLVCMWLAARVNAPWLLQADSAAALGVAGIVIWVSVRLGKRTVDDLLDAVPPGLREDIARAAMVPGVEAIPEVRVRRSGPDAFVEITLSVARGAAFERAHDVTVAVEQAVRGVLPRANVVVHAEPVRGQGEDLQTEIRVLAGRQGLDVHSVRVSQEHGKPNVDLHMEVSKDLTVEQAHAQADAFEALVRQSRTEIGRITTHLEPAGGLAGEEADAPAFERRVRAAVNEIAREVKVTCKPHELQVVRANGEYAVTMHCALDSSAPITAAHELTERIEQRIRARVPKIGRIVIHVEPAQAGEGQ